MNIHKNETGQALVEAALTIPFLLFLVVGAVEFGRAALIAIEVNNAAKAGAQYASQSHNSAADGPGIVRAARAEYAYSPSALAVDVAAPYCTCSDDSNPSNPTIVACSIGQCSAGANLEVNMTVRTSISFDPLIHLPGMSGPFNISGQAVQKVLQ